VRPTRAEIDFRALVANTARLKALVGDGVGVLAVIKADAYGHGAVPVARALVAAAPISGLAVSLAEEGIELRHAGVAGPILVMGGGYRGAYRELVALDLTPVLSDEADVEGFARAAAGVPVGVHVKLDTGMSRLGVRAEHLPALLLRVARHPEIQIVGFCTHLASADSDPELTRAQLARFEAAVPRVRAAAGGRSVLRHAANTAGTLHFPEARYDAVRPGLGVYQNVMRFVTAVAQIRDIEPGDTVSYGGLWRAGRRTRVGTLPVGYADGYPRRLTGSAEVLVRGRRCPVLGAVCMDMTMIDLSDIPDAAVGEEVVLLGDQGGARISAAELAARAGLVEYEITCGISKRVPRVYRPHGG
jgi:alanine racemase